MNRLLVSQPPRRLLSAGLLALLLIAQPSQAAPAQEDKFDQAVAQSRQLLRERLELGLPGFSAAVAIDGEIVWREAMGTADVESNRPVTLDTQFRIGSTSKALTSAIAMRLVERGDLSLDADIQTVFSGFPGKKFPLTVRDLISNQAGIRHYKAMEPLNRKHYESLADGLQIFSKDPLLHEPGTEVKYSSYGFNLAGAVMAAASKLSFGGLLERELAEPLALEATVIDDPTNDVPNRTSFYSPRGESQMLSPQVDDSYKAPSGGLLSTPSDIVRFGSALLHARKGEGTWLSADSVREIFTSRTIRDGSSTGYGLGFRIQEGDPEADPPVLYAVHHGGSSVGGRSMLLLFPDEGIVVSVLCNSDGYKTKEDDAAAIARFFRKALKN